MFDINNIFLDILGYQLSYVEFIGTIFGLLCVYWASRENILTWPAGLVNVTFFFVIFYQVQLYANMFLQIVFFISNIYGWYKWRLPASENKITKMNLKQIAIAVLLSVVGTLVMGYFISNIHLYFPTYFTEPSAYPYTDSLVTVLSLIAVILMAKKKVENWAMWVLIDVICVVLYYKQGVYFISLEYLILFGIAAYGLYNWQKKAKKSNE